MRDFISRVGRKVNIREIVVQSVWKIYVVYRTIRDKILFENILYTVVCYFSYILIVVLPDNIVY